MTNTVIIEEKRSRKGLALVAGGAAAALILGGSSFALWSATSNHGVAAIETGQLTVDATVVDAWHHDTLAGATVVHVVPEDVVVGRASTTIRGVGDTLQGTLTVDLPEIVADGFDVSFETKVNGQVYAVVDGTPGAVIDLSDENVTVETVITVEFDDTATATTDPVSLMDTLQDATNVLFTVDQVAR